MSASASPFASPPRYDHVVIVVEENRTLGQIVGDTVNAPYITQLASGGVSFGNMFALTHPSQPNYLHLFSGSAQGVTDDELVTGYPFTAANLGASLSAPGFTFRGYSEGLRAVGDANWDPHTATDPGVKYRRKHNPWANWQGAGGNQLPAVTNNVFANFPTDFSQLPTVSFVVPDQDHDMHDGSRKEGDDWLRANLSAYADWAPAHTSLLVITWDEDDYNLTNRIPTVFHGANLKSGRTAAPTWTLHNLLRTLEDMFGTAHAGRAALVKPISGVFAGEPTPTVATFRQGLNGYASCRDTFVTGDQTGASFAASLDLSVDGDYGAAAGSQPTQALVRFDNVFGSGSGQVPANAIILSAKLILQTGTGSNDDTDDRVAIHRMIVDWADTATWTSLSGGVSIDNAEARSSATFTHYPNVEDIPAIFDVSADVEAWRAGAANRGWVLQPDAAGTDGWLFKSSETSATTLRPTLEIAFTLPATTFQIWAAENSLDGAQAAPTADVEGDGAPNVVEFAFNMRPAQSDLPLAGNWIVPSVGGEPYLRKPPLLNWIIAGSFRGTGVRNEWTARLPSTLLVLALVTLIVGIGSRWLTPAGALIAGLFVMTNLGMLEKGRLAEIEALYTALTGAALLCWLVWWREERTPWLAWTAPFVFLGLGLLAKGPLHLLFFYAVVLGVLWQTGRLRELGRAPHLVGITLMLAIFALWAVPYLHAVAQLDATHACLGPPGCR